MGSHPARCQVRRLVVFHTVEPIHLRLSSYVVYEELFHYLVRTVFCYELLLLSMQKTSQFKTQCKGDISHAFETAKITVFYPTLCKTPDVPLQNELLC